MRQLIMFDPRRHTVPILQFIPPDMPCREGETSLLGSGVFVVVEGKHFVITAAHVLEDKERTKLFGFGYHADGGIAVAADSRMPILHAQAVAWAGDDRRVQYSDAVDISVIRPTPSILTALLSGYTPYDLSAEVQEANPQWFIVCGWPGELVVFNRYYDKFEGFDPIVFNAPLGDEDAMKAAKGNARVHQVLKFDRNSEDEFAMPEGIDKFPDLHGVSGGGVWAMREEDYNEYPSAARCLAGIAVEDDPDTGTFLFVKAEHLIKPIRQSLDGPKFHQAQKVRVRDPEQYGVDEGFIYAIENPRGVWVYKLTASLETPEPLEHWIQERFLAPVE